MSGQAASTLANWDLSQLQLFDQSPLPTLLHRHFRPLYANRAAALALGYPEAAMLQAMPLLRPHLASSQWPMHESAHAALLLGEVPPTTPARALLVQCDGQEQNVLLAQQRVLHEGKPAMLWQWQDISPLLADAAQLAELNTKLRAMLEILPYPVLLATRDHGQIIYINRRTCLLLQENSHQLRRQCFYDFCAVEEESEHFAALLQHMGEVANQELNLRRRNGQVFIAEVAAISIVYEQQPCMLITLNDVSLRKQLEAQLYQEATTDSLTGMANRRHWEHLADQEWRRAKRFGRELALMLFDLDHFKHINDAHGHAAGDRVLQQVALVCRQVLRGSDWVGRIGGEEFAVLLPETGLAGAREIAERLRRDIAAMRLATAAGPFSTSISLGVTELRPTDSDWQTMLQRSDVCLYQAKLAGRNRVMMG